MTEAWMRVRVSGPLLPTVRGFAEELARQGYALASLPDQVRLLGDLSRWLATAGVDPGDLTADRVEAFLQARQAGYAHLVSRRALGPLLGYLRALGVVPEPVVPVACAPREQLLDAYCRYLVRERGLVGGSVRLYARVARLFLSERSGSLQLDLQRLGAAEVTAFVLRACRQRSGAAAKTLVTALRSLLHFLFLEGWLATELAPAVPAVAGWRMSSLPRMLDASVVAGLLASCDRARAVGRRDFAILTVLSRLGLRGQEVADLALEDVDWRAGELLIHGKGRQQDRLPLPADVGEALADYLQRGRPQCACRRLFVSARAPRAALSAAGIRSLVRDACARAGLPRVGAHRLRHTVATDLLRHGAPLWEVAQVLRHRSLLTTAIYAKVDRTALAALARPWPGGEA
jgi:site-specific recombinase XerD